MQSLESSLESEGEAKESDKGAKAALQMETRGFVKERQP